MSDFQVYESTKPKSFKITLNGVGVNVTLASGDVKIIKDGGTPANVATLPTAVDGTNAPGLYRWTPTLAEMQAEEVVLMIKDQSGSAFDENMLIFETGGNASARWKGAL
jgi:hypothetical protein